jgi:hypothetical protein
LAPCTNPDGGTLQGVFFIDDGPQKQSLEVLIEYYINDPGSPTKLTTPLCRPGTSMAAYEVFACSLTSECMFLWTHACFNGRMHVLMDACLQTFQACSRIFLGFGARIFTGVFIWAGTVYQERPTAEVASFTSSEPAPWVRGRKSNNV